MDIDIQGATIVTIHIYRGSAAVVAFAFFPRTFFGGVGLGGDWVATKAETRARTAVRKSGLYPRFAGWIAAPSERRTPERGRMFETARALATACVDAFTFRVVILIPVAESETSIVLSLARPENL